MAGDTGEAVSAIKKLKLTLKDAGTASAQQWRESMWLMLIDCTRTDRGVQETIWRGIMSYIERITAHQANHYATAAAGTPYVPPTLAVIQSWVLACSCGTPAACTCGRDETSGNAYADFQDAMEDIYGRTHFTGTAAAIAARKKAMVVTAVKRANGDIVNAILTVVNRVPHLSHCQDLPSIKKQIQSYNQLDAAQIENFHLLPLSDLIQAIFRAVRSGSSNKQQYANIFAPPNLSMSLMQYQTDVSPAFDQLAALKIATAEQLLDVLRAMSSIAFISAQAANNNGNRRIR